MTTLKVGLASWKQIEQILSFFLCIEEILGCLQFVTNYRDRFGHGPTFFEGTLEDAVKTACSTKSAKDVSEQESTFSENLFVSYLYRENFSPSTCITIEVSFRMCSAGNCSTTKTL